MRTNKQYIDSLLSTVLELITEFDTPIFFDSVCVVKVTPHSEAVRFLGVVKNMHNKIKILLPTEEWETIDLEKENVGYVLATLNQRLKGIKLNHTL